MSCFSIKKIKGDFMKTKDKFIKQYSNLLEREKEIYIKAFLEAVTFLKEQEVKGFEREVNEVIEN